MTVGAISGVYQYTSAYQSQFFSTTLSADKLNDLMKQFGVLQTGDQYADLQALYQAMYNYYSQNSVPNSDSSASNSGMPNPNTQPPWAPLMAQVGLPMTGSLDGDYAAFTAKINQLQQTSSAAPGEKGYLNQLQQEAPYVFIQPPQATENKPQASGADIMAMINKALLFG